MRLKSVKLFVAFAFVIYGVSLFTPYYFSMGLFSSIKYVSGFQFGVPIFSLLLIIPIVIFTITKHSKVSKWLTLILPILLVFPVNFFQFILIDLNKYNNVIPTPVGLGFGYYSHITASLLLLIAGILNFKQTPSETRKTNQDLIDSF